MKKLPKEGRHRPLTLKFDLKMKLTTLLLITMVFAMQANDSYSQKTRISLDVENITIDQVLDRIESTTEFKFIYNIKNVDLTRKVSIKVDQIRIQNILRSLFNNTQTSYKVRGRQVVLTKNEQKTILKVEDTTSVLQQTQKVTGQVLDNLGAPLPGVSIVEKGTINGIATDFDGNFEITVTEGATLVLTSIGFKSQEIKASKAFMNITLKENTSELDEVIVVAQGISKSKKALGYAVSQVATEEIEQRPEADVARTLQGKIAGVQINASSGSSGNAATVRVRSSLSITQSNGPLIVINNVPTNTSLIDIDPNDIESLSVLKGLNASVLYGSQGRNGVILIQTKSGSSNIGENSFSASISQTTYINQVANLPEYQNTYGGGGDQGVNVSFLGSWGARFTDVTEEVRHPLANNDAFPEFNGVTIPYAAAKNNVKDFFRQGLGNVTSLNISSSTEKTRFNLSAGFTDEQGIIGDNDLKRANISVGGTIKINDKLDIRASLRYSSRKRNSQNGTDIFELLHFIPRSLDIFSFPFENTATGENIYYRNDQNPRWLLKNTGREDDVKNLNVTFRTRYKFNENIGLTYRIGFDNRNDFEFDFSNKGGSLEEYQNGFLNLSAEKTSEVDQSLIMNFDYDLSEKIGFEGQLGLNSNYRTFTDQESDSDQQIGFGFLRPTNFVTTVADFDSSKRNFAGAFAQLEFNYDRFFYLNLSGRNDWGSTVERENRQLFYPGVSFSFIPTSAFNTDSKIVNYLKIRGAYATSSGYPPVFSTRPELNLDPLEFANGPSGNISTIGSDRDLANLDLKPELHKEFEVGIEGEFFNNVVSLEVSAFKRISENQILEANLDGSTGFLRTLINAGRIDTEGLEIDLGIDLVKTENFSWNFRNIFTAYESLVVDLPSAEISLGVNTNSFAIEGQPLGIIKESYALRDSEGNFLINPENGNLIVSDEIGLEDRIIADPTPDWAASSIHTLRYKNLSFSAQFEYSHGGESFSQFVEDLLERGVTRDTENREGTFIIPGVYGDGNGIPILDENGNTIPNTIQQNANRSQFSNYYEARELLVFDNSVFRIREIALAYVLDGKKSRLPFKDITFTFSGRNIFYHAPNYPKYTNIDPELNTNGGDVTVPTTKRFSLGVSLKF